MTHVSEFDIEYLDTPNTNTFGRPFVWNDKLYSGISYKVSLELQCLRDIGLLKELEERRLVPEITFTNLKCKIFHAIISFGEFKLVGSASEWSFDMIRSAGSCILDISLIATKYNYQLSNLNPQDISFKGCVPVFIGMAALKPMKDPFSRAMFNNVYRYFKYPLDRWNKENYIAALNTYNNDNAPSITDYTPAVRPTYKATKSKTAIKRVLKRNGNQRLLTKKIVQEGIQTVRTVLERINRKVIKTDWGDYHDYFVYKNEFVATDRFKIIINKINYLQIESITELAGNWGLLSALIMKNTRVKYINCTDFDENAVNKMYNYFRKSQYKERLFPGLIDFMNPIGSHTSGNLPRRFKSEAVLALAVTHHLTLSDGYDLDTIFNNIAAYSSKFVFIEYMPLGLWNGISTTKPTPEFYTQQWFTDKFREHFSILEVCHLEENRILYIGQIQ